MDRKEKIMLLNNIAKGIIKADSLKPQHSLVKMDLGSGNLIYLLNNAKCTKETYETVCKSQPNQKTSYVTLNLGHSPSKQL